MKKGSRSFWKYLNGGRVTRYNRIYCKTHRKRLSLEKQVRRLVVRNLITKTPCFLCGEEKVFQYHEDYKDPYEVKWACAKCKRNLKEEFLGEQHGTENR